MRLSVAAVFAVVVPFSASGQSLGEDIHKFTLDNGLEAVVIEDHRAPVVTNMVWYKVGSADEPPGESGIAHFLEHLMFKATETLDDGEFSRIVSANGGDDNAFTTMDHTAYFQRIAADRLDLVMGMEADRMVNLDPGEAGVLSERDVVLEERRQRVGNSPYGPYNEQRQATLYLNHPYGKPVIGWPQEIAAFTEETAMDFYRQHYAPNNAILVVAGDVTVEEVKALAEKHFGSIPASDAIKPRVRPQEPEQMAARRLEYHDPRVRQPNLSRAYLAPTRQSGDQGEAAALTVLAELLGGSGITSLLARELQFGPGAIALGSGAYYSDEGVDPKSFNFYVTPKPGVSLEEAEAGLDRVIASFLENGPDPVELERIKAQIRASRIYALDNQQQRARNVGNALTAGLTIEDVLAWPDELEAVTAEDVLAAAQSVFNLKSSVTALLMDDGPQELMQ